MKRIKRHIPVRVINGRLYYPKVLKSFSQLSLDYQHMRELDPSLHDRVYGSFDRWLLKFGVVTENYKEVRQTYVRAIA